MARRHSIYAGFIFAVSLAFCRLAAADPCLVVYPTGTCTYHYDPTEYYTVGPGHPLYDPAYDRGGEILLEVGTDEVDLGIYQATGLIGFVPSTNGEDGFFFDGTSFQLIIDGFSNAPTTYSDILVVFDRVEPEGCAPTIRVQGSILSGNVYHAGDLVVQTPTPDGNNYSDVMTLYVRMTGCTGVHIWAFSDEDHDGVRDGPECFTAFSHDVVVPVEHSSWGRVKALYR